MTPRCHRNTASAFCWSIALLIWFAAGPAAAQPADGYRLLGTRVLVNAASHWEAWEAQPGVRVIDASGSVRPRRLVDQFNAATNATEFSYSLLQDQEIVTQGGISAAGTNRDSALYLIDGDSTTFWEPDRDVSLDDWFAEIDLGRALIISRIELRFVDEVVGDPFLRFRVLISDGLPNFDNEKTFFRVGLVNRPNKDQRTFSFDIVPQRPVADGIEGEIAQFVRLDVLDTDGPRAEEITTAQYDSLPEPERGAVDYFRTTASGRELHVSQDVWEGLPVDLRGPIRRYRHERPRLAEVKVIALGENVVGVTQRDIVRDADAGGFDFFLFQTFTDGLFSSWFPMRSYDELRDRNQVRIDLRARYWLNRLKLLAPQSPPQVYQVRISDGALDPSGDLVWTTFPERRNRSEHQHVEEAFPTQKVRFIEVRRLEFSGVEQEEGNLSEIQAYGEGFVSDVEMTSPFIRLGQQRMMTAVDWDGEALSGTRVEITTRAGDEIVQIPHYFAITGREISKNLWERIPESVRTEPVIEEVPGSDWSNWSEPYVTPGEAFRSPTPSRNALVRVRLISDEPLRAPEISSLQLRFRPPLVDKVLAEVHPSFGVEPGIIQEFTLYFRPQFIGGNPGFDSVQLRSSSSAPMEPVRIVRGSNTSVDLGFAPVLWDDEEGIRRIELTLAEDGFDLSFPEPIESATGGGLYAITFRTRVFLQSTTFRLGLAREGIPGVMQAVSEGDATDAVSGGSLSVVSDLAGVPLLDRLSTTPRVITPNGDGINEELTIDLSVFHVEGEKLLIVEMFDLSGRRVRDLTRVQAHPSGDHTFLWDGRDQSGRLLPPGTYVVRAAFAADGTTGTISRSRVVGLVY
ncbi:MAG TPA: FlgD immunoglobulin-like domain containing protein [Candidatus Latescibacteria bacterium]|nr:FlgD immunoglobulin-like domain containing protein [Candidatus Latescibacterota bacterium]